MKPTTKRIWLALALMSVKGGVVFMSYRTQLIGAFIVGLLTLPILAPAQPTLETFKELLVSPPAIEEMVAERSYAGSKRTDFYFCRWQSNAFLLSISPTPQAVNVGGSPGELTDVCARFDDRLWTVFGVNRPVKTGTRGSISSTNELVVATDIAARNVGRLLSCGVEHVKATQIYWTGNRYAGTNLPYPGTVSGQAHTNVSGVVTQLDMDITFTPPGSAESKVAHWEMEYQFDASVSDVYPTVIKRFVLRPNDRFLRDEIRIRSVKIAKQPLSADSFDYAPFADGNSWILYGRNGGFYYTDKDGNKQPLQVIGAPGPGPPISPVLRRLWRFWWPW